jgi:hypothetical protein
MAVAILNLSSSLSSARGCPNTFSFTYPNISHMVWNKVNEEAISSSLHLEFLSSS